MKFQPLLYLISSVVFFCDFALSCNQLSVVGSRIVSINNVESELVLLVERNVITKTCNYAIAIDKGLVNNGNYNRFLNLPSPSFQLPIQFWNLNLTEIIKDFNDTTPPTSLIMGSFQNESEGLGREERVKVIQSEGGVDFATGDYENSFNIFLYTQNNSNKPWVLKRTVTQTFRFTNAPAIETSVVDPGGPYQEGDSYQLLDFGVIEEAEEVGFDLMVKNNNSFTFSVDSANGGYMFLEGGNGNANQRVNYKLVLSATAYNPKITINTFPYTSEAISPSIGTVNRFPFNAKILGNLQNKRAGSYLDQVTINFTAL